MSALGHADDVTWVGLGNVDTMLGALRSKQIDLLSATASMRLDAEKNGWAKLIFLGSEPANWDRWVGGSVPVNAHICLLTTVQKAPEKAQAYVNAAYRAAQWIKTHSPDEIYACIEKYVGDTTRDSTLAEIESIKAATDFDGAIDEAAFARGSKAWYSDLTGIKPVALAEVFEPKFLRAAQAKYKPA
jgi:NitT/TauT family transport system substrate-binding protein